MKRLLLGLAGIAAIIVLGSLVSTLGTTHFTRADQALSPTPRQGHYRSPSVHTGCAATSCHTTAQRRATALPRQRANPTATATPLPPKHKPSPLHVSLVGAAIHVRYVLIDPPMLAPGASASVHGGGFAPGAALRVTLNAPGKSPLPLAETTAGTDGTFQTTVTAPMTQTAPSAEVTVQDDRGRNAGTSLVLQTVRPLAGIVPNVVSPGQRISLWAANFRPGEQVRVYAGRGADPPLLIAHAGNDGRGSWPLSIPYGPSGNTQLVMIGDQGRAPVTASYLLLNLYAHASVSSYAPLPGAHISFFGGGFGPDEPVDLRVDRPEGPVLATTAANKGGGVGRLGPFLVPFGLRGPHTFILRGRFSHVMATVGVIVQPFIPSARPSSYAAGPGTLITFYGKGFAPSELVRVYLGRTAWAPGTEVAALRTTPKGNLVAGSGSFALPVSGNATKLSFALIGDVSGAVAWTCCTCWWVTRTRPRPRSRHTMASSRRRERSACPSARRAGCCR